MRRIAIVSLFALLAALSAAAQADPSPWYVGLTAGPVNLESLVNSADTAALPSGSPATPETQSNTATGSSVLGGYQFNARFGLEASYVDLGSASFTEGDSFCCVPDSFGETYAGTLKLKAASLNAVFRTDLPTRLFLFGKVGLSKTQLDERVVHSTSGVVPGSGGFSTYHSTAHNSDATVLDYGVGVGYALDANWSLRLGWTWYHDVGDSSIGEASVTYLHLDLLYRF